MTETPPPSLPAGPRNWVAASIAYLRDPARYHARMRARHGDPFLGSLGPIKVVTTGRSEAVREIFAAPQDAFAPIAQGLGEMMGEYALPVLEGAPHVAMRRVVNAVLLDREDPAVAPAILGIVRRHVAAWPRGRAMQAEPLLRRISFDVILRLVYGVVDPVRADAYAQAFARLGRRASPLLVVMPALRRDIGPWSPWGRFLAARRDVHALIDHDIAAARAAAARGEPPGLDTLSRLAAHPGKGAEATLSDAAIRDTLTTLLAAGHESTAAAMAWVLYWSWSTPGVLDQLRAELDAAWGNREADEPALATAALSLPYLEATCREGLRLSPVAPMVLRQLARPFSLAGRLLPAGVQVGASIELAHANPAVFPDPHAFRPERFLAGRIHPADYFPFGGGRHFCPGARLAFDEMRLVLAVLARMPGLRLRDRAAPRRVFRGPILAPARGAPTLFLEETAR